MFANWFISLFFGVVITVFGVFFSDTLVAIVAFGLDNYHTTPATLAWGAGLTAFAGWTAVIFNLLTEEG